MNVVLVEDLKNVQALMADLLGSIGEFRIVATIPTEAEALDWLSHNPVPGNWRSWTWSSSREAAWA